MIIVFYAICYKLFRTLIEPQSIGKNCVRPRRAPRVWRWNHENCDAHHITVELTRWGGLIQNHVMVIDRERSRSQSELSMRLGKKIQALPWQLCPAVSIMANRISLSGASRRSPRLVYPLLRVRPAASTACRSIARFGHGRRWLGIRPEPWEPFGTTTLDGEVVGVDDFEQRHGAS